DDVKSYPTLAAGQLASIQTNVGGRYEVRVVMTPENTQRYRDNLATLRSLVEREIDGSASAAERIRLFLDLVGIKAAIRALESSNAAGCSGRIKLAADEDTDVIATVNWVATSGAGFWDATCGSN
ncbi:MAG TPA: hypothetical protein VNW68_03950, partial [Candidatus Limnocylindria bacterium]|nr:hypothetical protein [Candidatus Limnocylindria bacterium]